MCVGNRIKVEQMTILLHQKRRVLDEAPISMGMELETMI